MAAIDGHKDVVELLLANKAEVNAKDNVGLDAFALCGGGWATRTWRNCCWPTRPMSMPRNNDGVTPLHLAALNGHKDVAELLLANKAEVNAKDNHGETPLHLAAVNGHKDVAELLLANKADVNAKVNDGSTPLHYAVTKGHGDVAELLRQYGGRE